jgi:hypothetical protein
MSRQPSPHTNKGKLDNATPGTKDVGLGQIIDDLITAHNLLVTALNAVRADHNTLIAKLNADAGVTDTNYAVSTASAQTAVTVLSAR